MKQGLLALSLTLLLGACTPGLSPDIGGAAERAASQAVETAVESAVDTLVQRTVDQVVGHLYDLVIASAIDGIFGVGAEVEFGPEFALELYTGSYEVALSGRGAASERYSFTGGEPVEGAETFSLGVGLRLENDEGQEVTSVSLIHAEEEETFVLTLIEGRSETGDPVWQAGLQFDDEEVTYLGEANVETGQSSSTRYTGSFNAKLVAHEAGVDTVTQAAAGETVLVAAAFDVPINPAGSLFVRQVQTAQDK